MTIPVAHSPIPPDQVEGLLTLIGGLIEQLADAAPLVPGDLGIRWDRFDLDPGDPTTIIFDNLRFSGGPLADSQIAIDLSLVFRDGGIDSAESYLRRHGASESPGHIGKFYLSATQIVVLWREDDLNSWTRALAPGIGGAAPSQSVDLALSVMLGGAGNSLVREIRLDWIAPEPIRLNLPGLVASIPQGTTFTLLLQNDPGAGPRVGLIVTLDQALSASSTFAWKRDADRELQNDSGRPTDEPPLFELRLSPTGRKSLVLLDLELGGGQLALPKLFRQLAEPLEPLADDPTAPVGPVDLNDTVSLAVGWTASFTVHALKDAFELPFLKNGALAQVISIRAPDIQNLEIDLSQAEVLLPFEITVTIGKLQFDSTFQVAFDLNTFALGIKHDQGIDLYSKKPEFVTPEYLGLRWRFSAPEREGKRHYLTLVTARGHYEVIQAPDSLMELEFDAISEEPIVFLVRNFKINASGISLSAAVSPEPVRLKGLDTKFSFRDSELRISNNQIEELQLGGAGALPPALVGDAAVNILLRFARDASGVLRLQSGDAGLALNKPLECKLSRFRFTLSRLDVGFFLEGKYHLYFMLTGSAEFALQPGDDVEGPLALLPKIKIDLVKAPLTGDTSVLINHVDFLITLPRPISFSFLSCFEMEVRSIGFRPQAKVFDGDGAMQIGGQIRFAQGEGDNASPQRDYHSLYIGLPKPGDLFPRIFLEELPVSLAIPGAFTIEAVVNFINTDEQEGFSGSGRLDIRGMPSLEAAFSFVRVRRDADGAWVRAWFIALNVGKLAILIPVVQIYIREIGLGFGYRYTVTAIKAADEIDDVKKLIAALDVISRSQGDLSRLDSWKVDIEGPNRPVRWTIAFRALIAQTAASIGAGYDDEVEEKLRCLYLFDALFVFRSNFTFFINARGWINTNYNDYLHNVKGARTRPFVTGYMLLHPQKKRFLARLVNNPNGILGLHPEMPSFIEAALRSVRFSITLLVEPGLVHFDMGWPDKLRWQLSLGPLRAEYRGGMIFRVALRGGEKELVIGVSSLVKATLDFRAEVDLGFIGVRVRVFAEVAYSLRYIGVLSLSDPFGDSAFYARVGLEIRVRLELTAWIDLFLFSLSGTFSLEIHISAALELAINGIKPDGIGLRGTAHLSLEVFGHGIGFDVNLSVGGENVDAVIARTARYDAMGMSSDDPTDALPAPPGEPVKPAGAAMALGAALESAQLILGGSADVQTLEAPEYTIFAIEQDGATFFAIFPRGEAEILADGTRVAARGFLPVPPTRSEAVSADFALHIPGGTLSQGSSLVQLVPSVDGGIVDRTLDQRDEVGDITYSWKVNWDAAVMRGRNPQDSSGITHNLTLGRYLREMFAGQPGSLHDPVPFTSVERSLEDARVDNPSEADYEAAVRGAFEQFRGSPYFKFDERSAYDQALAAAFSQNTTVYSEDGSNPVDQATQARQRVDQMRGMVIQTIVDDLRQYVEDPQSFATRASESVAFQLGLVFRCDGPAPLWLHTMVSGKAELPQIRQRLGEGAAAPSDDLANPPRYLRVFNTLDTSFAARPPAFSRVRSYSSANTIAISWSLAWDHLDTTLYSPAQANPNHHLSHYLVQRRALDSSERALSYRVKPAQVLHRQQKGGRSELLRIVPRFQVIDHFNHETADEQAALPASGLRYLYTITPVDYADRMGRPLTMVVTRFPDEPPQVPADARLLLRYRIDSVTDPTAPLEALPKLRTPQLVLVDWSEPPPPQAGPAVAVAGYRLIFRRDRILAVGSYGLDSATSGDRLALLPSSLARTLPTDIVIDLNLDLRVEGMVSLLVELLTTKGVFPANGVWRPEAWHVFIQTVAINGTPSSMAPVQIALEFERVDPNSGDVRSEERQPSSLEWLPGPASLPLLPPEDQRAQVGDAHFPMPILKGAGASFRFAGSVAGIAYQRHPAAIRCVRFRWNQGPSGASLYPLELHAGYRLLELDVDAHTDQTFADSTLLAAALRPLQEVQLIPDDEVLLSPQDTLGTSRWEAWYASAVVRHDDAVKAERELPYGPWYSWRDSILEWPSWPGLTVADRYERGPDDRMRLVGPIRRSGRFHPFLTALIEALAGHCFDASPAYAVDLDRGSVNNELVTRFQVLGWPLVAPRATVIVPGKNWEIHESGSDQVFQVRLPKQGNLEIYTESEYIVDQMVPPPTRAADLPGLLNATPPTADPYGWGVLQQLGLSVTFGLRYRRTREPVPGEVLLAEIQRVLLSAAMLELQRAPESTKKVLVSLYSRFLHIEALFQPGRSVELREQDAAPEALLGLVQVSLRPTIRQVREYGAFSINLGSSQPASFDLVFDLPEETTCSVIDAANSAAGQIELRRKQGEQAPTIPIFLPKGGNLDIRIRAARLPAVSLRVPPVDGADPLVLKYVVIDESDDWHAPPEDATREIRDAWAAKRAEHRATLAQQLEQLGDHPLRRASFGEPTIFAPTDDRAATFSVPESLVGELASSGRRADLQTPTKWSWIGLKRYLEALNLEPEQVINVPLAEPDIAPILPALFSWLQRFFDHGGVPSQILANALLPSDISGPAQIPDPGAGRLNAVPDGPWMASAYPRVATPALVAPDSAGRIRYDHLLIDRWGHLLRYYVQPYSRYERLWSQVLTSTTLFGEKEHVMPPFANARPKIDEGALDVVVERTEPVAPPVVLRSGRLDPPSAPGTPAAPGRDWEVIVAEHSEQRLSESNQTLARRLEFRQLAFTLLRRFAYNWWTAYLQVESDRYQQPAHIYPEPDDALPGAYPEVLDHLDLTVPDKPSDAYDIALRSIELPLRVPTFQQGYMALQWQGLPFYYEHRLLLIAQAAGLVSKPAQVIQRDFAYRSPAPLQTTMAGRLREGWMLQLLAFPTRPPVEVVDPAPVPVDPPAEPPIEPAVDDPPVPVTTEMRGRRIRIKLRNFWESLPDEARETWPAEDPARPKGVNRDAHKSGALPDPEVVYQLIERFSGNVEVQAELFFNRRTDTDAPPIAADPDDIANEYVRRQLGRRFLIERPVLLPPKADDPEARYLLETVAYAVSEEPLSRRYPLPADLAFRERIAFHEKMLLVYGVLSLADRDTLWAAIDARQTDPIDPQITQDRERVGALYESWFSEEPVSVAPTPEQLKAPALRELVSTLAPVECSLVWSGPLSASQRDALLAALDAAPPTLADGDAEFKAALRRLARAAAEPGVVPVSRASVPLGLDQVPGGLDPAVTLSVEPKPIMSITLPATPEGEPEATSSLTIDANATHYIGLEWQGPLYDSRQLQLLADSLARWSTISAFRSAVNALLQKIETREESRELTPGRPIREDLPDLLRDQLNIDERAPNPSLSWIGVGPDLAQQRALRDLVADKNFVQAAEGLLTRIDAPALQTDYPEPPPAPPPGEGELPPPAVNPLAGLSDLLRNRLVLTVVDERRTLSWSGPLPADDTILDPPLGIVPALATALVALKQDLTARRKIALLPGPKRPRQKELAGIIAEQLSVTSISMSWRGRIVSHDARKALEALGNNTTLDQEFYTALRSIIAALDKPVTGDLALPRRRLIDPPSWLNEGLLIGRARLRYHGLMDSAEGNALRQLFPAAPDRAAIQRIYEASLSKGMRGRALLIRTRRGSAAPSAPQPISPEILD